MKNIVIAAGFATKLYPLAESSPNPQLEIGNSIILGRLLDDIDEHIIITSHKFAQIFKESENKQPYTKPITVIDDETKTNDTRLGAVKDLQVTIDSCNVDDNMMVVVTDNILDFSLQGFVDFFKEKDTSVIMCHNEAELKKLQRAP